MYWNVPARQRDILLECHPLRCHQINSYPVWGKGGLTASLYHTRYRIHTSLIRGRWNAMRDSALDPASAALRCRSLCKLDWIWRLRLHPDNFSHPYFHPHHNDIHAPTMRQVSCNIHSWQTRYPFGGLGNALQSSSNRQPASLEFHGFQRGECRLFPR